MKATSPSIEKVKVLSGEIGFLLRKYLEICFSDFAPYKCAYPLSLVSEIVKHENVFVQKLFWRIQWKGLSSQLKFFII